MRWSNAHSIADEHALEVQQLATAAYIALASQHEPPQSSPAPRPIRHLTRADHQHAQHREAAWHQTSTLLEMD